MNLEDRCTESVYDTGRSVGSHRCCRKGILEYEGKKYCKLHYPPNVKLKDEERNKKWEEKWKQEQEEWKKEDNQRKLILMIKKLKKYDLSDFEKIKKLSDKC